MYDRLKEIEQGTLLEKIDFVIHAAQYTASFTIACAIKCAYRLI